MNRPMVVLLGGVILAGLAALGCLIKEDVHTLYLAPDGSVTWAILEKDVRSDLPDPGEARNEEEAFLRKARTGEQEAASHLEELRPDTLHTRILRDERPYWVLTEARFVSADALARSVLAKLELRGDAELQTAGGITRLVVRFYPISPPEDLMSDPEDGGSDAGTGEAEGSDSGDSEDPPLAGLEETLKTYKIILTEGRFLEGRGFRISDDHREAVLQTMTVREDGEEDGALVYSLAWTAEGVR